MIRNALILTGVLLPLFAARSSYGQEAGPLAGLDAYVDAALEAWRVPGVSIAVVKDGAVLLTKGYGVREMGGKDPVDEETLFAIASNTKAFTATAIGILVEEGDLEWDAPVQRYMPEFQLHDPVATRKITVRDLLCHRSGLPTFGGDLIWFDSDRTREEVIERLRFVEPAFDFRTSYGYSNLMFLVAGELIPRVCGQSWDSFLAERIFKPLGMSRSSTSIRELAGLENVATGHTLYEGKLITVPYNNMDNAAPAGAINSSAKDMSRWLQMQLADGRFGEEQVVPSSVIAEMRKAHNLTQVSASARRLNPATHLSSYGLGVGLADYQGRLLVRHTGGLDGMYSIVAMVPEERLGVCVLTNRDDNSLNYALAYHILDALMRIPFQDWSAKYLARQSKRDPARVAAERRGIAGRLEGTRPSHELRAYAGSYTNALYGEASIVLESDGKLKLRLLSHPYVAELTHWHVDVFMAKWDNRVWNESAVRFDLGREGGVEAFRIQVRPDWIDPVEYRFVKR